jgi:hypothetical protein
MEITEKKILINRIEEIDNSVLISRINHIVGQIETDIAQSSERLNQYTALIDEISNSSNLTNEPLISNLDIRTDNSSLPSFEHKTAGFMFFLSLGALILSGLLIMYGSEEASFKPENRIAHQLFWLAMGIWPVFMLEYVYKLWLAYKKNDSTYLLIVHGLAMLFPPARLVIGSLAKPNLIWLPILGWSKVNPSLEKLLKKKFLLPILVLGLLMVPALLIEIKFKSQVIETFPQIDFAFWLQTFHALVWAGFALEFMVLISITEDKKNYCVKNWMDILILVLPVVSFFRSFRFLRVLKFNQLAQSFRMKGTKSKIREGLVLLDFLKRLDYFYNPEGQIKKVKKKMIKNEQERIDLENEMLEAVQVFLKKKQK